jgi:AAA domain
MTLRSAHQRALQEKADETTEKLMKHVRDEERLAVVQAPPGSGKTHLLLQAAQAAYEKKQRVAIATQTRSQADDICRRLSDINVPCIRFVAQDSLSVAQPPGVTAIAKHKDLPNDRCIVVGTTAKWGLIELANPFDVLFVEEAWQMGWADFMLLGQVAPRFVLIGDPGQIPPVVSVDASRWETAPRPPHWPAPELILRENRRETLSLSLPATRRLPASTHALIQPFYDFPFACWPEESDRQLKPARRITGAHGAVLDQLGKSSVAGLTLPTPAGGPPLECDEMIAKAAVDVVRALLESQPEYMLAGQRRRLEPAHIGLCATHHVMNTRMSLGLDRKLRAVQIDTPERWQGLERPVMVIVHPLSGVVQPSEFDLETGRLCVMASRHQISLVIVTRDHLPSTLDAHMPSAGQPVGRPDVAGRGHHQNTMFWSALATRNSVVQMAS